jgi:hypothetical protein
MSGHFFGIGVSVIMAEVKNKALFAGMFKPPDFPEEF